MLLHLDLGQSGLLVTALLVGGLRCVDARPWRGGFLLGLLVVKPTLALLVPVALLAGGRGRAVAGAVLGACACVAATLVVFGSGPFAAWVASGPFEAARAYLERGFGPGRWMSVSAFTGVRLLGGSVAAGYVVQAAFALATAILVAARWRGGADRTTRVAAVLIGSAAMSPYLHTWDLVAASVGAWLLARRGPRPMSPALATLLTAVWLAPIGAPFLAWACAPLVPLLYPCLLAVDYAQVQGE